MSFIATGLGIAGLMGVEGAMGAAATVAMGEALGAGVGALTNPNDRLKGALMGGLTGAAGGALGAGIGALGGAAAGEVGGAAAGEVGGEAANAVAQTGEKAVTQAALTESPGAITSQGLGSATNAPTISAFSGAPAVPAPVVPPADAGGLFSGGFGSNLAKQAVPEILKTGTGLATAPSYDNSGQKKMEGQYAAAEDWGHFAEGGVATIRAARGGSVHLRNGDFIIPADVVSALGNGSTKAGAKYLTHLFNSLHAGPPPKAGSLAKRRAKERHTA